MWDCLYLSSTYWQFYMCFHQWLAYNFLLLSLSFDIKIILEWFINNFKCFSPSCCNSLRSIVGYCISVVEFSNASSWALASFIWKLFFPCILLIQSSVKLFILCWFNFAYINLRIFNCPVVGKYSHPLNFISICCNVFLFTLNFINWTFCYFFSLFVILVYHMKNQPFVSLYCYFNFSSISAWIIIVFYIFIFSLDYSYFSKTLKYITEMCYFSNL